MKIPSTILTLLLGISLSLISLWVGQHHGLLPIAASHDAELVDELFNTMMTISVGLFLLVQGVLVIVMIKFRRRPGDLTDGPAIEGNIPLEILWTAIPTVIVFMLSIYSFDVYRTLGGFGSHAVNQPDVVQVALLPGEELSMPLIDSSKNDSQRKSHHHIARLGIGASIDAKDDSVLAIDVMGMQYAWLFTYPAAGITTGELHVPVGQEVQLNIKAQDVLHALWLPEFRIKQDAIPNQDSELRFKPEKVGEYSVVCAELCGPYHGAMVTKLYVQEQQGYDDWLQSQIASKDDSSQTVALNPEQRSDADFLAPFVSELGINAEMLQELNPHYPA